MTYSLTVFLGRDETQLRSTGLPSRESAAKIAEAIAASGRALRFEIAQEPPPPSAAADAVIT